MSERTPDWLDRSLTVCAYYYCLCVSEREFFAEVERMEVERKDFPCYFTGPNGHATTHYWIHKGKPCAIVCLDLEISLNYEPTQVAALLVHEAVHIWQRHAAYIGSHNDHGDEEEAYAIQNIAQALMENYAKRLKEYYERD